MNIKTLIIRFLWWVNEVDVSMQVLYINCLNLCIKETNSLPDKVEKAQKQNQTICLSSSHISNHSLVLLLF